jgi:hypothetical protein
MPATTLASAAIREHHAIQHIVILSTDPLIPARCPDWDATDQTTYTTNFTQEITNILDSNQRLKITIAWVLPGKGLKAVQRAKSIAAEAARCAAYDADNTPPPSKAQLRLDSRTEAVAQWQACWTRATKLQPAYLTLHSPPDGKLPRFTQGLAASHPHPPHLLHRNQITDYTRLYR